MRITKKDFDKALADTYRDLQDMVKTEILLDNNIVEPDDPRLLEMRVIKTMRKLRAKRS